MVYSQLGRLPTRTMRYLRIIKYWLKLIEKENYNLRKMYEELVS